MVAWQSASEWKCRCAKYFFMLREINKEHGQSCRTECYLADRSLHVNSYNMHLRGAQTIALSVNIIKKRQYINSLHNALKVTEHYWNYISPFGSISDQSRYIWCERLNTNIISSDVFNQLLFLEKSIHRRKATCQSSRYAQPSRIRITVCWSEATSCVGVHPRK